MEDAFVIANLLKEAGLSPSSDSRAPSPTAAQLQKVAARYQEQRGKRVGDTVLRARKRAAITHALESPDITKAWYEELQGEDGSHIMEGMSKTILGAPKELDNEKIEAVKSDDSKPLVQMMADSHS
jgi:FAD-dependent urate hydroxylase